MAGQEQTSDIGGDTMMTYLDRRQKMIDDRLLHSLEIERRAR